MTIAYFQGFGLGAGLIIAIGAQNAHVLRTGLLRQHVGLTVAVCIVIDVLLISLGVAGMGALIERSPALMSVARWGGALFLALYGLRAWRQALSNGSLRIEADGVRRSALQALTTVLAMTLLNPHLYLDTVVLLGSVGGQQPPGERGWFAAGAATASTLWFCALGFGARLLTPLFARPVAWRVLDGVVGAVMAALAATLALGGA